ATGSPGDNSGFTGLRNQGYRITGADAFNGIIDVNENNVFFRGFAMYFTGGTTNTYYDQACIKPSGGCNLATIQNMLFWTDSPSHITSGVFKDRVGGDVTVENCVFQGFGRHGCSWEMPFHYSNQDWIITNCTFYDCGFDDGYIGVDCGAVGGQQTTGHDISCALNHCLLHAHSSATDVCVIEGIGDN